MALAQELQPHSLVQVQLAASSLIPHRLPDRAVRQPGGRLAVARILAGDGDLVLDIHDFVAVVRRTTARCRQRLMASQTPWLSLTRSQHVGPQAFRSPARVSKAWPAGIRSPHQAQILLSRAARNASGNDAGSSAGV